MMRVRLTMRANWSVENPPAISLLKGLAQMKMTKDRAIIMSITTLIMELAIRLDTSFLPKYRPKTGMKADERAPTTMIWKIMSGSLKAAQKTSTISLSE